MARRLSPVLLLLQMLLLMLVKLGVSGDMVRHWGDIEAVAMIVTRLCWGGRHVGHRLWLGVSLCLVTSRGPHGQAHRRLFGHGLGCRGGGLRSAGRLGSD